MASTAAVARSRSGSPPHKRIRVEEPSEGLSTAVASSSKTPATPLVPRQSKKARKNKRPPPPEPCTAEDVNLKDVYEALGAAAVSEAMSSETEYTAPIPLYTEIELTVSDLTSHGEAIALLPPSYSPWAILVPFALPGEKIMAKIYRHARLHSYADLVRVTEPNHLLRDDSRVQCKYFGTCGGCQYQMLSYETQLGFKRTVVEKAYKTYSGLPKDSVPDVLPTIPSPKQYAYRTKITPHFDAPPKSYQRDAKAQVEAGESAKAWEVRIGFDQKGRRTVMDIEDCPIGTAVVNKGMVVGRKTVQETISTFKRGSTLLLRDSLPTTEEGPDIVDVIEDDGQRHICVTNHKATVRERVGSMLFDFPAGSFFQNNNSILVPLTTYVRDAIFSPPSSDASTTRKNPTHLVDTYCGSGLFAITLSPHFSHVAGIEIDPKAIECAKHNLSLNALDAGENKDKHAFHAGKSEDIFASVLSNSKEPFPPDNTAVVIDPPRKGCDESFIKQVVEFGPSILVYVSCNVHTQARDVGMLIRKMEEESKDTYVIETLRGFDLFPQTAHVESVAVLRRQPKPSMAATTA